MIAVAASACGCATVDPAPDYARATSLAAEATGYERSPRPADDDRTAAVVADLLADGLTVDEAVNVVLLNNPDLAAAFYDVGVARADVVQAGLLSNPTVGVSLRFPAGGGLANLESNIAQNIAELWQIPMRRRAAERSLEREVLTLARAIAQLALDAKAAYYDAVGAAELHAIVRENLSVAAQSLDLVVARRDIGSGTEVEVNLARSVVLEAELSLEVARLEESEARRRLAALLGLTDDAERLVLSDSLPTAVAPDCDDGRLVATAMEGRLDVRAAWEVARAAESLLKLEYRRVFPTVELGLGLERGQRGRAAGRDIPADTARASIREGRLAAPEIEPRSGRDTDTDFIIGPSLSLEVPIFDQNQARIAGAAFAYEQAVRRADALQRRVVQSVRGAAEKSRTAYNVAVLYRDRLVPLAESSLEMSRESLRAGKTSFLFVLESQRFYLNTRSRNVAAWRDFARTLPALEAEVGVPLEKMADIDAGGGGGEAEQTVNDE